MAQEMLRWRMRNLDRTLTNCYLSRAEGRASDGVETGMAVTSGPLAKRYRRAAQRVGHHEGFFRRGRSR